MEEKRPSIPFFATDVADLDHGGVVHISRVALEETGTEGVVRENELEKLHELGIQIVDQEEEKDEMFEAFLRDREVAHRS